MKYVPTECLIGSSLDEKTLVNVVEVREIGVDLDNPISLYQNHRANVGSAGCTAQERLAFEPCNNVMQAPGCNEYQCCGGQIPAEDWAVEEYEEPIGHC
jgi:hypothetical protein